MRAALLFTAMLLAAGTASGQTPQFDHAKHAKVFPTCVGCHAGAAEVKAALYPDSGVCASCHDGTIQKRVPYVPPDSLRTNLRFSHLGHLAKVPAASCSSCHQEAKAPWMNVGLPVVSRCFECHGIRTAHLDAPDTACATCHYALPQAVRLARADVAKFPTPPSHQVPGFASAAGHGAQAGRIAPVSPSCATCHSQNFCLTCHVDAPEQPAIQALAADPRGTAIPVTLNPPASHADDDFLRTHGPASRLPTATCATCHTQQSCLTCHAATPAVAAALHPAGPGRGPGALVTRHRPSWHTTAFIRHHAPTAETAAKTCASCHSRSDCVQCHSPDAASAGAYHPAGFLSRHPAAAYARESSCNTCHNPGQFCVSCHKSAGLVATAALGKGYHDASRFFVSGHGVAARQSLETCTSCHVERDCLTCHSALGGRRFDPHGPGFDAARMIKKNPEVCTACHGTAIPTR